MLIMKAYRLAKAQLQRKHKEGNTTFPLLPVYTNVSYFFSGQPEFSPLIGNIAILL